MRFDSKRFPTTAKSTGFDAGNLEKVLRLRELLNEFQKHSFLRGKLVLKGGTALNLFYLGLARLPVDIDLNYIANIGHDEMMADRADIVKAVEQITTGLGYKLQNGVDDYALREWQIDTFISSFVAQVQDPSALLIFVSHNVLECDGGCLGYHDVLPLGAGIEQTYIYTTYNDQALFTNSYFGTAWPDINTLSHEVSEWVNDPFGDNLVPAWSAIPYPSPFCSETGYLEVADPVEFLPQHALSHEVGGVTWHPYDIVFLPWFEQASSSTSVNGWYTFANSTPGPPEPCITSGDYNYTTLDFPQAARTRAIGVNN